MTPTTMTADPTRAALAAVWDRRRDEVLARVDTLQQAAIACDDGSLDATTRRAAEGEAHKLAGSLGMFGFHRGSELSREAEQLLAGRAEMSDEAGQRLAALVDTLRNDLGQAPDPAGAGQEPVGLAQIDPRAITVLAIDDDPVVLDALEIVLQRPGLRLVTLADATRFWEVLDQTAPDLLMLDVEMPGVDGFELCRGVRASAAWATLPVLFLTGKTDPETVQAVFAVGADDYVSKPIQGLELRSRIDNRLERIGLYRRLAEEDGLTGLLNRRRGEDLTGRLLRLGARTGRPVSFAALDVDRFKQVNDNYGHPAGDEVLRDLGRALLQAFRGDDVVARWGGEEFAVAMYDATREVAAERLRTVLADFSQRIFRAPDGRPFQVTFSGGVAQSPDDGQEVDALHAAADGLLYQAKDSGRARVLSC